ncbi:DUF4123 domain-containing protein [Pseudoduganella sp. SL102]|uniref:DUF4123 domain-containing protein n=1 Tax=Pseudoduganella sp. SL102 TaxID=2995154 RepID=UPI00248B4B14|nr:DUF4123 domain-containing protein [Pseudoduganella sp. SL102]WBS04820.1 DUF4123 domain-containing protein [Pseudoduganella sp. SL102]
MSARHFIEICGEVASGNSQLYWYAIADSAQDASLPEVLSRPSRSLFDAEPGSPLARKSPHLVDLGPPGRGIKAWEWIARNSSKTPSITVITSLLSFSPLLAKLKSCAEIILPDGDMMFFAFWDPAILGTLLGQQDDLTLHVPGPVLTIEQRSYFAGVVQRWWYWDRNETIHEIQFNSGAEIVESAPFQLSQTQIDQLVEASLPDNLLYFVDLNQPYLLYGMSKRAQYEFVRTSLFSAREIGLESMRDLVNYVCLMLICKRDNEPNPHIAVLLDRVRDKELTFDDAMKSLP